MDRGAWRATVHAVAKSWRRLDNWHFHLCYIQVLWLQARYLPIYKMGILTSPSLEGDFFKRVIRQWSSSIIKQYIWHCLETEKAMAPHSSTLAWKIPWAEEPGGLQSMGFIRVRHYWVTSLSLFTFMHWRRKWHPTPLLLPGRIPGMGEPSGLPSMGPHRVGHNWSDLASAAAAAAAAADTFWLSQLRDE